MEKDEGEATGKIQPPPAPPSCYHAWGRTLPSLEVGAAAILPSIVLAVGKDFPGGTMHRLGSGNSHCASD